MLYAAINQWSYAESLSPMECLNAAKQQGFGGFEPAFAAEGGLSLQGYAAAAKELKAAAADAGLRMDTLASGLYWQFPLSSDDPAIRQKAVDIIKQQMDCAAELGAKTILVVPATVGKGFFGTGASYADAYSRAQEGLGQVVSHAKSMDIVVGVENVWNNFLLSPLEFARFLDEIGSPYVKAYFDVGNVVLFGDSADWIHTLGKRIAAVHVKDFRKAVGTLSGFVPLMEGDVDWPAVMAALRETGYDGPLTAEISPLKLHPTLAGEATCGALQTILSM